MRQLISIVCTSHFIFESPKEGFQLSTGNYDKKMNKIGILGMTKRFAKSYTLYVLFCAAFEVFKV